MGILISWMKGVIKLDEKGELRGRGYVFVIYVTWGGGDFKDKKWIFEMRDEKSTPALLSFFEGKRVFMHMLIQPHLMMCNNKRLAQSPAFFVNSHTKFMIEGK